MTPAICIERFKPLEGSDKVSRATEKQGDTARADMTGLKPAAKPRGLINKTEIQPPKASGMST